MSPDDMARVCMENYDPEFNDMCKPGDILFVGYNFGCGSSREQAALSLKFKGREIFSSFFFEPRPSPFKNTHIAILY